MREPENLDELIEILDRGICVICRGIALGVHHDATLGDIPACSPYCHDKIKEIIFKGRKEKGTT